MKLSQIFNSIPSDMHVIVTLFIWVVAYDSSLIAVMITKCNSVNSIALFDYIILFMGVIIGE